MLRWVFCCKIRIGKCKVAILTFFLLILVWSQLICVNIWSRPPCLGRSLISNSPEHMGSSNGIFNYVKLKSKNNARQFLSPYRWDGSVLIILHTRTYVNGSVVCITWTFGALFGIVYIRYGFPIANMYDPTTFFIFLSN